MAVSVESKPVMRTTVEKVLGALAREVGLTNDDVNRLLSMLDDPGRFGQELEDLLALKKLAQITPSNSELRALAAKSPQLATWFDEEEDAP
jgi:hypothetical protein